MNESIKNLIRQSLSSFYEEVKDLEENNDNTFKVIASSEDMDRAGEIIKIEGWDDTNYKKNPVIIANHNYTIQNIVGKMTKIYKDGKNLIVEGIFTESTEAGRICKELYNSGFLKAVSVGFQIKARNEQDRDIIEKAELLELSFVAVPCNPNAISLDEKTVKKAFELGLLEEKKLPTVDLTEFENLSEKELEIVSKIHQVYSKKFDELDKKVKEHQKIFDNLADGKALLKSEDSNSNNDDEIVKGFLQNLSKNVSSALHQMKKQK